MLMLEITRIRYETRLYVPSIVAIERTADSGYNKNQRDTIITSMQANNNAGSAVL